MSLFVVNVRQRLKLAAPIVLCGTGPLLGLTTTVGTGRIAATPTAFPGGTVAFPESTKLALRHHAFHSTIGATT